MERHRKPMNLTLSPQCREIIENIYKRSQKRVKKSHIVENAILKHYCSEEEIIRSRMKEIAIEMASLQGRLKVIEDEKGTIPKGKAKKIIEQFVRE